MKKSIFIIAIIATIANASAQNAQTPPPAKAPDAKLERFYIGLGLGLDYGAIGAKAEVLPTNYIGFFVGAGYFKGFRFNLGGELFPFSSRKQLVPVLTAFWGYNGYVEGATVSWSSSNSWNDFSYKEDSKTSYGITVGGGFDIMWRKSKLSFRLFFPFRSDEEIRRELPPIALSAGFNFEL